ncbi:hypothetical protein C3K47_17120 [Solitalea longa]|uniref:Uncharacterized protein n=1 Tax=Solitalea longa TaxID=2079460 RepID=A0A2S4ZXN6_9SPHI|nr:hypothetical protein [Solitalea longa]POY35121.1 hypothetical protein C3K47_17120 [Solitalea longa]
MSYQNSNYDYLIQKLDEFIRKYYKNRLIQGSLYVVAILAACYLILTSRSGEFATRAKYRLVFVTPKSPVI